MRILLLGATGRTGRLVIREALNKGYRVNCLCRKSERIAKEDGLTIIEGNPKHEADLRMALSECDSVISVLNISRKSDFPWSGLRTPKTFLSDTMNLLVRIAGNHDPKRICICSAWGAAETRNHIPKWFKWLINNSNIGIAYLDHERQEKILVKSAHNWTIVRPVGLTNSRTEEKIRESFDNRPKPNNLISRQSLARYLVESLETDSLIRKKVVVSKE